jgi:hypothetical protein
VPQMRNRYGSLYPASYFRLQDAYDLKNEIEYRDASHQAYFNQFNAGLVDEASMNRQIDDGRGAETALNASGDSTGGGAATGQSAEVTRLQKAVRDKLKEVVQLKKDLKNQVAGVTQQTIDDAESQLDDLREQLDAARENDRASQDDANAQRADKIQTQYDDISDRVNAAVSFASWQRKMEDLQIRAGKRNIVNTYVWDGDGGLHAEEQQFASSVQHSIGGSFVLGIGIGGLGEVAGGGAAFDLKAQATIGLTQTVSKTESTSSGVELHVDLSGVESRGITDFRDVPLLPGEKVDRYRFMSFYLENNAQHWHDFFDHVVDPEWLASNDEEARALRQAQQAQPNKTWRVLHRVTYVERPALMGLGRTVSRPVDVVDELAQLRDQVSALRTAQEDLRKMVEDGLRNKLPQLLADLLKPGP